MLRPFYLVPFTIFPVSGIINCFTKTFERLPHKTLETTVMIFFSFLSSSFGRIVKSHRAITILFDQVSDGNCQIEGLQRAISSYTELHPETKQIVVFSYMICNKEQADTSRYEAGVFS